MAADEKKDMLNRGERERTKFQYNAILNPKKIRKGRTRWNQVVLKIEEIDRNLLEGPILDFGSGVGYFVHEGLKRGFNVWGVDMLAGKIQRYQSLIHFSGGPLPWADRCLLGNGNALPFSNDLFSLVTSWFVFEHIAECGEVLREIVRTTRPGGVVVIRAQDARCNWEGHCKIPWIPFLPKYLEEVWVSEFGKDISLRSGVYEITQDQIISILEMLGCSILKKDEAPCQQIPQNLPYCNEQQVRETARRVKKDLEEGKVIPRQDGLYLFAKKR